MQGKKACRGVMSVPVAGIWAGHYRSGGYVDVQVISVKIAIPKEFHPQLQLGCEIRSL